METPTTLIQACTRCNPLSHATTALTRSAPSSARGFTTSEVCLTKLGSNTCILRAHKGFTRRNTEGHSSNKVTLFWAEGLTAKPTRTKTTKKAKRAMGQRAANPPLLASSNLVLSGNATTMARVTMMMTKMTTLPFSKESSLRHQVHPGSSLV